MLEAGYVAYMSKHRNYAIQVIGGKRDYRGPHMIYNEGYTAVFRGHLFTTNDKAIIKAMDEHVKCGRSYQRITTPEQYALIKAYGKSQPVRFNRGPATTMAEKLGAPKTVPIDTKAIKEIAPGKPPAPPAKKAATKKTT